MIIYPAIDLRGGHCVRLVQGRKEDQTVYSDRPEQVAAAFEAEGARYLHVVDLDGAFEGRPQNLPAIAAIAGHINIPFQVGGGLRSQDDVKAVLDMGAARVIIGTRAVENPRFIADLLDRFGPERIVLGLDAKDGMVAVEGWLEKSSLSAVEFGQTMKNMGVGLAISTDVSRDGLLQGPNFAMMQKLAQETGLQIIASGGVSSLDDIRRLKEMEGDGVEGAIIGKALYEGKVQLSEALRIAGDSR